MSPHTVLHDYSSHLFLQLLLTGWHLVAPAVTPVRPLQVFIVHVPLPFLYGESKAAAYLYFAGPLVSPAAYSPLPRGPSLIDISKSSNKSARRWQISRGFSLSYSLCNLNWEWSRGTQTYTRSQTCNFSRGKQFKGQIRSYFISQLKRFLKHLWPKRSPQKDPSSSV